MRGRRTAIEPRARFLDLLADAIRTAAWPMRLVLAKHVGSTSDLVRVQARPVQVKGETLISFVYRYVTRDVTVNLPVQPALQRVDELLGHEFHQANLLVPAAETQLSFSKRGKPLLRTMPRSRSVEAVDNSVDKSGPAVDKRPLAVDNRREAVDKAGDKSVDKARGAVEKSPRVVDKQVNRSVDKGGDNPVEKGVDKSAGQAVKEGMAKGEERTSEALLHNREKQRVLSLERPFLRALGVTDDRGRLIPSMSRKWKQINRFIEVFSPAWNTSGLSHRADTLRLIDFGSGKGYLTFALHDYLQRTLGRSVETTGVERRADLVKTCSDAAEALRIEGLAFRQGDIDGYGVQAGGMDVMIALHACDTATDDAIYQGVRAGAAIIMCAPCCHKQLRPQLLSPHPLRPILQHGIHLAQEAEMLTDGLRALLLEACGYEAQVFEFVSLEHTGKNKMILAAKRPLPRPVGPVLAQIQAIKSFYGIREQRLETLLRTIIPPLTSEVAP